MCGWHQCQSGHYSVINHQLYSYFQQSTRRMDSREDENMVLMCCARKYMRKIALQEFLHPLHINDVA